MDPIKPEERPETEERLSEEEQAQLQKGNQFISSLLKDPHVGKNLTATWAARKKNSTDYLGQASTDADAKTFVFFGKTQWQMR